MGNAVRADDPRPAAENSCIIRAKGPTLGWVNPLAFRRSLQEAWGTILV